MTTLFILWREKILIARCFICQRDKNLKHMRYGLKNYNLIHAIFGGLLAMGDCAVPSIDPYLWQANDADDYDSLGDKENDDTTMETGPRYGDKRAGSSRRRKGK